MKISFMILRLDKSLNLKYLSKAINICKVKHNVKNEHVIILKLLCSL